MNKNENLFGEEERNGMAGDVFSVAILSFEK
jgi:hypothetical protein